MIERPIPQDILKYKQKAIGNFSAREIIFGGIGAGVIAYFAFNVFGDIEEGSYRAILSAIPGLPFLAIGFLKIYGMPFEKSAIPMFYDNFLCPIKRLKEIHYKEYEDREKTRYWIKPNKNGKMPKIKCKRSKTVKAIK